jgi:hypothetical protein
MEDGTFKRLLSHAFELMTLTSPSTTYPRAPPLAKELGLGLPLFQSINIQRSARNDQRTWPLRVRYVDRRTAACTESTFHESSSIGAMVVVCL